MKVQPRLGVNYHGDNYVTYSGVVKDTEPQYRLFGSC
jgi:hypothetical protein